VQQSPLPRKGQKRSRRNKWRVPEPQSIGTSMLPYWLLFLLFAVGAVRFGTMPATAQAADMPLQNAEVRHRWENLGRGARFLPFAALVPALMIGFRYAVGTDWGAYVAIFREIQRSDLGFALVRIDPAYGALNWIAGQLGAGLWLVNLVCGLLFMFGLVRFARAQPNPWLAVAVAVPYFIIGVGMGYSRQAVAIALSMAGLAAISKGSSFTRFALWVIAGTLFHRTAIILIPLTAIAYAPNRFQATVITIFGCILGYYLLTIGQGFEHFQHGYISQAYQSQGAGVRLAMNVPPALVFLGMSRRFTADETERKIWSNFAIIAILSFILWFRIDSTAPLDRMALYIIPLQIFVLSRIPHAFSGRERSEMFLVVLMIAYSALVQLVWLDFSNNAKNWVPYRLYPGASAVHSSV